MKTNIKADINLDDLYEEIKHFAFLKTEKQYIKNHLKNIFKTLQIELKEHGKQLYEIEFKSSEYEKVLNYIKYINKESSSFLISKNEAAKKIKIRDKTVEKLVIDNLLNPYLSYGKNDLKLFDVCEVEKFEKMKRNRLEELTEEYYTKKDLEILINKDFDLFISNLKEKFGEESRYELKYWEKSKTDEIDFSNYVFLYSKKNCNELLSIENEKENLKTIVDSKLDASSKYKQLTKKEKLEFIKLWDQFSSNKLKMSRRNEITEAELIRSLDRIRNKIKKICEGHKKDINDYSSAEINFNFFNEKNFNKNERKILYSFFQELNKNLSKVNKKTIDINRDNNPWNQVKESKIKEYFTIEEYLKIFEINQNLDFHFKNIDSLNKTDKLNYISFWIYNTFLLTNTWRHSDLMNTEMIPIEFLKNSSGITEKESINSLLLYLQQQNLKFEKTDKSRYFNMTFELAKTLFSILNKKVDLFGHKNGKMIDFNNKRGTINSKIKELFLGKEMSEKYSCLTMNRTLLTLLNKTMSEQNKVDRFTLIKEMRSHSSDDVTNIYIKISQEQIDNITDKLFSIGSFGYAFNQLNEQLYDEDNSIQIANYFENDKYKLDSYTKYLKNVMDEKKSMKKFIDYLKEKDKNKDLKNEINMGLKPSRTEDLQCLVGCDNCPFKTKDCFKCVYNVPNRTYLIKYMGNLISYLDNFLIKFNETKNENEKIKLSNTLFYHLDFLKESINYFGRESIDKLIDGGLEKVNEKIRSLPSVKKYITIG